MTASVMTAIEEASERQLRRDFALPEEEVEFLEAPGRDWETIVVSDGGAPALWLLIYGVSVPPGLEARDTPGQALPSVTMAFRVTGYPGAALDMVYVFPPLARASRTNIGGLTDFPLDGRVFQQWSRHYQYDPAAHELIGHFRLAQTWLEKEASS